MSIIEKAARRIDKTKEALGVSQPAAPLAADVPAIIDAESVVTPASADALHATVITATPAPEPVPVPAPPPAPVAAAPAVVHAEAVLPEISA